jgi:hypothetical protein
MRRLSLRARYQTAEWADFREHALARLGRFCSRCGATKRLQVHHVTYARWMREKLEDVVVLCFDCHRDHHNSKGAFQRESQRQRLCAVQRRAREAKCVAATLPQAAPRQRGRRRATAVAS